MLTAEIGNKSFRVLDSDPIDISIPLLFDGEQPNTYNIPKASAQVYQDGEFIGDTRQGGGCNFEEYKLIPHCNGTHTECIGHITDERIAVYKQLITAFIPSTLITVDPVPATDTEDLYAPEKEEKDLIITKDDIKHHIEGTPKDFLKGLIIRTGPNDASKKSRNYMVDPPAFFSLNAMRFIVESGVEHLLVDLPSVDRTFDNGELNVHHLFWNMDKGSHAVKEDSKVNFTITEMIYVDDSVKDGQYLLNLQIPSFSADAAPSRPLLFKLEEIG